MKKISFLIIIASTSLMLQSCELVEGIFKAGMWWAFFLVALVVIGLFWLLRRK
ncbi:phosphatidate cytidylyltransferase [Niabella hibiscisoli]|uniref:phosphatidate cytidylyltransferase n=1 Tax=Niabella hibiscisoli TaxID=1825928 RepID=UPI001F10664E|nr:phosphatidate cytidylyltransferase [Niabella hibiscisoli]MCH5717436.1 phosphatidate cytidylyltransferase [Niabella hibiscisoli]